MTKKEILDRFAKPYFCEDIADFHKLMLAESKVHAPDPEEAQLFLVGIRVLLHDYLALVMSGKMAPYEMDEDFVEREQGAFREVMNYVNADLMQSDIPLVEGENGKLEVDYEKLRKKAEEEGIL